MIVSIDNNPLDKLQSGIDKLANPVKKTVGPGGENMLLDRARVEQHAKLMMREQVKTCSHLSGTK